MLAPVGPGYCNTVEAQEKDLKITFVTMIDIFKKKISKSLKEIYESTNKQYKEMNKKFMI